MVRAPARHAGGKGFESLHAHHPRLVDQIWRTNIVCVFVPVTRSYDAFARPERSSVTDWKSPSSRPLEQLMPETHTMPVLAGVVSMVVSALKVVPPSALSR